MNTGLQDAHNLAFKLHDVVVGRAPAALLDRYEIERRPVAQRLLRTTDTLFLGITTRSPLAGLVRKYVPRVALPFGVAILPHLPIGRRLAGYLGQIWIHYQIEARSGHRPRGSRLCRDAVAGRRLPWTGRNFDALRSAQWQLHLYAADTTGLGRAEEGARQLRLLLQTFGGTGSTRLRPGLLYLVRPDGLVAAAAPPEDAVRAFRSAGGLRPPHRARQSVSPNGSGGISCEAHRRSGPGPGRVLQRER